MDLSENLRSFLPPELFSLLRQIADEATRRGLSLYTVGGLPRDLLLRRSTRDLDLVLETDALPFARAIARAHGGRVVTHSAFHTATWFPPAGADSLDLISARSETYAHPAALPTVSLGALDDDLRRRDFTINTLAIRLDSEHFGKLFDPFHGETDLRKRLVRVLHPLSFIDDPTRIFRAVRYAERYGFKLASDTQALIPGALKYVDKLSPERLRHELDLILEEENAAAMLASLAEFGLLTAIKPHLPTFDPRRSTLLNHVPLSEFGLEADPLSLGYLLWLMDCDEATLPALAKRLGFTLDLTKSLRGAARLRNELPGWESARPSEWTKRLDQVPPLAVYAVHLVAPHSALKEYLVNWRHVKPTVNGDDLKARGLTPGPAFKRILSALRSAWLNGEIKSKAEEKRLLESLL